MINLIPPTGRKAVTVEYWTRVITVWLFLLGFALLIIAALNVPAYVLIDLELKSVAAGLDSAQSKQVEYDRAKQVIKDTNALAEHLTTREASPELSGLVAEFDALAGAGVSISSLVMSVEANELTPVTVIGVAKTRADLTAFSTAIESHPQFIKAEVPLANLAKDQDIDFNISVTVAKETNL